MNIITTLIADGKAPVGIKPGEGALKHPSVSAQPLAALNSFTCYAARHLIPLLPSAARHLRLSYASSACHLSACHLSACHLSGRCEDVLSDLADERQAQCCLS